MTHDRAGAAERKRLEGGPAQYPRQTERVLVLTRSSWLKATIYYPEGTRLSDVLNSPTYFPQRYLPLADVEVYGPGSSEALLQTRVMLVSHQDIVGIVPLRELVWSRLSSREDSSSPPEEAPAAAGRRPERSL
jgi:hypothetical protein